MWGARELSAPRHARGNHAKIGGVRAQHATRQLRNTVRDHNHATLALGAARSGAVRYPTFARNRARPITHILHRRPIMDAPVFVGQGHSQTDVPTLPLRRKIRTAKYRANCLHLRPLQQFGYVLKSTGRGLRRAQFVANFFGHTHGLSHATERIKNSLPHIGELAIYIWRSSAVKWTSIYTWGCTHRNT